MKTLKLKQKRSFTVVEMMVALILFSVIMFILLSLMTQSQNIMQRGISKANVNEDAMMVLNRMADDLSCADFAYETDESYLEEYSVLTVEKNKCEIITRRYSGTSMLCKVVYSLDGNNLKETVYDFDSTENDFSGTPSSEEFLLQGNVVGFNVIANDRTLEAQIKNSDFDLGNPQDATASISTLDDKKHPFYVTIRLVLMDDEMLNTGITQKEIAANNYPSANTIKQRLGADKFNARLRVMTRTVSLNVNALDLKKLDIKE